MRPALGAGPALLDNAAISVARFRPEQATTQRSSAWRAAAVDPYASWGLQNRSTQGSFEDFASDRFIIGDEVSVKAEIARYRELLGVDHFIMRCQWPGLLQEQVLNSIQRLGEIFAS